MPVKVESCWARELSSIGVLGCKGSSAWNRGISGPGRPFIGPEAPGLSLSKKQEKV